MDTDPRKLGKAWYEAPMRKEGRNSNQQMPDAVHNYVFSHVKQLEEDQRDIHMENMLNCMLYTNRQPMAFSWDSMNHAHFRPVSANLENVIQSVVDALGSRIGTSRPKATIVPRGAEFRTYLRGRRLDKYLWGEFTYHKVHTKMDQAFTDACVYGTGALKVDIDGDELFVERVNPDEIIVDQRECVSNEMPTQVHHRKLVSRLWLLKTFGKTAALRDRILECQDKNFSYTSYRSPGEDQIVIVESWKLPTRKGAGDGRHTIVIENATLKDEEYDRCRFPFVFLKYAEPQFGFYGRSLVGDLTGYQIRLNELNDAIRYGQDLMCVPRVLVEQGSAVVASQFDNTIGKELKYRGTKPEALVWPAFNPEIYNERDRIKQAAFSFAGISEFAAQNEFPSQFRADSSEAIRELNANQDQRFNRQAQAIEAAYKELAEHLLELSSKLYKHKKVNRKVVHRSQFLVEQIDWASVDMDRDRYVLEISSSSIINMTPAARKDTLTSWLQMQIITPEQYKAWSGSPDLERLSTEMEAGVQYGEWMIGRMLEEELISPDTIMDLPTTFKAVKDTYMHLRTLKDEEENGTLENVISIFADWMTIAEEMMNPPPPPQPEMPMEPGMEAPMMGPEAAGAMPPAGPEQLPPEAMGGPGMVM